LAQLGLLGSTTTKSTWNDNGKVDHDISKVVSGISDTALKPDQAIKDIIGIFESLYQK
jgi:ethanolamine ammonia-lyase large subunit